MGARGSSEENRTGPVRGSRRAGGLALRLLPLLAVVPLWIVSIPPIQDLPNHLGRVHVLLDLLRGGAAFGGEYRIAWLPLPGIGADALLAPLLALFPAPAAGKLFLSFVLLLTAGAGFRFLRAAGAPEMGWFALPLVWNWFVHMGFLGFLLSFPLALLAFAWRLEREDRWGGKEKVVFGLLATATYLCHIFSFAVLLVLVQVRKAARGRRRDLLRLEPGFLPGIACWLLVFLAERGGSGTIWWQDPLWKAWLVGNLFRGPYPDGAMAFGLLLAGGVLLAARRARPGSLRAAAAAAGGFLLLPRSALPGYGVDARVLPFLALLLLAGFRAHRTRARNLGLALFLGWVAFTSFAYGRLGPGLGRMVRAAEVLPRGSRVVPVTEKAEVGSVEVYHHLVTWLVSSRDVVTPHLFAKPFQHEVRAIRRRPAPHEYWFKGQGERPHVRVLARAWDYAWLTGRGPVEREVLREGEVVVREGDLRIVRWSSVR